jgi:hypothetical protein
VALELRLLWSRVSRPPAGVAPVPGGAGPALEAQAVMAVEKSAATAASAVKRAVVGQGERPVDGSGMAGVGSSHASMARCKESSRKLTSVNETLLTGRCVTDLSGVCHRSASKLQGLT